jgi:hypothetical protein
MSQQNLIIFNHNWNNKLDCNCFTSIRLNSNKFIINENYSCLLKSNKNVQINKGTVRLVAKYITYLDKLTDLTCYLNTGYSAEETKNIIRSMYKNTVFDWNTQKINVLLFKKVK